MSYEVILIDAEKQALSKILVEDIYEIEEIIGRDIDILAEFPNGDLLYGDSEEFDDDTNQDDHLFFLQLTSFPVGYRGIITGTQKDDETHYPPSFTVEFLKKHTMWISKVPV